MRNSARNQVEIALACPRIAAVAWRIEMLLRCYKAYSYAFEIKLWQVGLQFSWSAISYYLYLQILVMLWCGEQRSRKRRNHKNRQYISIVHLIDVYASVYLYGSYANVLFFCHLHRSPPFAIGPDGVSKPPMIHSLLSWTRPLASRWSMLVIAPAVQTTSDGIPRDVAGDDAPSTMQPFWAVGDAVGGEVGDD